MLTRHCSHCLVKNKGGCSFVLFNYDSYVSFRAIDVIRNMAYLRVDCRTGVLALWTLCLVPYPVGPIIKTMKTI